MKTIKKIYFKKYFTNHTLYIDKEKNICLANFYCNIENYKDKERFKVIIRSFYDEFSQENLVESLYNLHIFDKVFLAFFESIEELCNEKFLHEHFFNVSLQVFNYTIKIDSSCYLVENNVNNLCFCNKLQEYENEKMFDTTDIFSKNFLKKIKLILDYDIDIDCDSWDYVEKDCIGIKNWTTNNASSFNIQITNF